MQCPLINNAPVIVQSYKDGGCEAYTPKSNNLDEVEEIECPALPELEHADEFDQRPQTPDDV